MEEKDNSKPSDSRHINKDVIREEIFFETKDHIMEVVTDDEDSDEKSYMDNNASINYPNKEIFHDTMDHFMEVVTINKDSDEKSYVDDNTIVNDITKLKKNIKP